MTTARFLKEALAVLLLQLCLAHADVTSPLASLQLKRSGDANAMGLTLKSSLGAVLESRSSALQLECSRSWGAPSMTLDPSSLLLRLRGGKKGTGSQGKRGTGHKAHPNYKYNLSLPRKSRADTNKRKRYTLHKKPERSGRHKHLRLVQQRFKNGFRCSAPYKGPVMKNVEA